MRVICGATACATRTHAIATPARRATCAAAEPASLLWSSSGLHQKTAAIQGARRGASACSLKVQPHNQASLVFSHRHDWKRKTFATSTAICSPKMPSKCASSASCKATRDSPRTRRFLMRWQCRATCISMLRRCAKPCPRPSPSSWIQTTRASYVTSSWSGMIWMSPARCPASPHCARLNNASCYCASSSTSSHASRWRTRSMRSRGAKRLSSAICAMRLTMQRRWRSWGAASPCSTNSRRSTTTTLSQWSVPCGTKAKRNSATMTCDFPAGEKTWT